MKRPKPPCCFIRRATSCTVCPATGHTSIWSRVSSADTWTKVRNCLHGDVLIKVKSCLHDDVLTKVRSCLCHDILMAMLQELIPGSSTGIQCDISAWKRSMNYERIKNLFLTLLAWKKKGSWTPLTPECTCLHVFVLCASTVDWFHCSWGLFSERVGLPTAFLLHAYHASSTTRAILS